MATLRIERLVKRYGAVTAVGGIDLAVADREFVVLVGPSGCGKSTTLRMIAGLEEITDGEIWIGERLVNELEPKDRDIAMVFQDYALYPHMSVFENMAFGLRYRRYARAEIRRRVAEAAGILGIEELLARRPKQLSGGQRQRVAMGRAIVRDPAVFLFDEPLSNLDAKLRVQMRTEIKRLHQRVSTTVVYVTHDQVEAMTLADRIVIMQGGLIEQVGTPDEIYNAPVSTYVAGFIGSPTMNLLPAELTGDALRLPQGIELPLPPPIAHRHAAHAGRRVTLGIRPEDFELARAAEPGIEITPDVIEPLGSDTLVFFSLDGHEAVARLSPRQLSAGRPERLRLKPDLERLHLFDAADGRALRSEPAPAPPALAAAGAR
jgi:multiple sugar transport system ATP-binding protein